MSNVKYILLLLVLLFCGSSCEEGFLDKAPDEDLTLTDVFAERQYAERFLTGTYNYLPTEVDFAETGGRNPFVGASDDMEMSWLNRFSHRMNSGSWGPTDVPGDHWSISYEAEFLKAFYHFLLMRLYGPIPIVDRSYNPNDDFTTMKRNTFSECVEFVVKKCDEAIALLPMNVPSASKGRATAAAALALKSRVLLYAASPLFNGDADLATLVDKDGVKLFGDYNAELWQRAATAAKECIDKVEGGGYKLYRSASNDPVKN